MRQKKFWTFERITAALKDDGYTVDLSTVYRAVQRINAKLAKEFRDRAEEIKADQSTQLEYIAEEAMRVWQESEGEVTVRRRSTKREAVYYSPEGDEPSSKGGGAKQPRYLTDEEGEVVIGPNGQPVNELFVTEQTDSEETRRQFGDPRYLAEARAAKADIRKIWGLDAVKEDAPGILIQKAYINVPIDDV